MKKKGFTLIEMIVATAIFAVIIAASMDFFINNMKISKEEQKKAYIDIQVKNCMDYIQQSLQMSWQDSIGNNDASIGVITKDGTGSISNFIKMEIPDDNKRAENKSLDKDTVQNTKLILKQSENKIEVIKNDLQAQTLLEGYVNDFNVRISGSLVTINLTVDYSPLIKRSITRKFNLFYTIRKD